MRKCGNAEMRKCGAGNAEQSAFEPEIFVYFCAASKCIFCPPSIAAGEAANARINGCLSLSSTPNLRNKIVGEYR